jgi:hypothetical protein
MGNAGTSMEPVMEWFSFSLAVLAFFPLSPFGAVASLDADATLDPSASLASLGRTLSCKHHLSVHAQTSHTWTNTSIFHRKCRA